MDLRPVVLDLDRSVGSLRGEQRIPLVDWQETLRFGCSVSDLERFGVELEGRLPPVSSHGTVLFGSGDFHHLSQVLIARHLRAGIDGIDVVVFDNHPDNMRFPFGTHCGSWVGSVAALAGVSHVHVVGITSNDLGWAHSWENRLAPLLRGNLTYWCTGVRTRWARLTGLGRAVLEFENSDRLVEAFSEFVRLAKRPIYLSIDKDVFAPEVVRTNWDQGRFRECHTHTLIRAMTGRVVGSDITGDVSAYQYRTPWKRWLSRWDGQAEPAAADLQQWRPGQNALDVRLVELISMAASSPMKADCELHRPS